MRAMIFGLIAGLVFGLGLVISGMSDPAKVLNFLDPLGNWDPSLLFVLGGASITAFVGFRWVGHRQRPLIFTTFELPTRQDIDSALVLGASLFGVGWGLAGYCPGPAWSALLLGAPGTVVFFGGMLLGMAVIMKGRRLLSS